MKAKGSAWQASMGVLVLLSLVSAAKGEETPKINLNTATLAQLDSLPGIGPVIAERILGLREKNGSFKRIEDLMNVRGIGEKTFLKLRDRITLKPQRKETEDTIQKSG